MATSKSHRLTEGKVLIATVPTDIETILGIELHGAGVRLSSLIAIDKQLSRASLAWELGTLPGEKPSVINDDSTDYGKEFYRTYIDRLNSRVSFSEINLDDYSAILIPNLLGLLCRYNSQPIFNHFSSLIHSTLSRSKPLLLCGYGITSTFGVMNEDEWYLRGYNLTAPSLREQSYEPFFQNLPFFLEDKIRDLGGNYCPGSSNGILTITDRFVVTCNNEKSLELGVKNLVHLITNL